MSQEKISFILTDIDDTLTDDGQLGPEAYSALWALQKNCIKVIPITGRPAGWCEMIARIWPVDAVVGENGAFYFRYNQETKKMTRYFAIDEETRTQYQKKLQTLKKEILTEIPKAAIASDQFCRLFDLAIDFCEDIPSLSEQEIHRIIEIFKNHKAQVKVSSIHLNGWFGDYNKLTTTLKLLEQEFSISSEDAKKNCAFTGDSPNDEPMFEFFPHSYAVANIRQFLPQIKHPPKHISQNNGGLGFVEIMEDMFSFLR